MRSSSRAERWLEIVTFHALRAAQVSLSRSHKRALRSAWRIALLCIVALASPTRAQAPIGDHPALRVVLSAPADGNCIEQTELEARVAERLGRQSFSERGDAESVRVELTRAGDGPGWQAVLRAQAFSARPTAGERRIEVASASCRDLDDALVLVLAALVGVARPGAGALAERAPDPPAASPSEPAQALDEPARAESAAYADAQQARVRRRAAHPLFWSFAAAGALATGRLPGLGWGASAALQLEWRRLTLALGSLAFPTVSKELGAGGEAHFTSIAGHLRLCGTVLPGTWLRAALCLGASSGAVNVRTRGLAEIRQPWQPSTEGELGLRFSGLVAWKVRWWMQLSGALPFTRMRFVFEESGGERRVYHRAAAGVLLEVGGIVGGAS